MASDIADQFKIAFALGAVGASLIWSSIKRHKKVREVEDLPCSKASSAAQGLTELQGFAWPHSQGPVTADGHELTYYSFVLQREVSEGSGKNRRRSWRTVYSRGHFAPFFLVDPTGLVVVDPNKAECNIANRRTRNWSSISELEKNHYLISVVDVQVDSFPPSNFLFGMFSPRFRIVESEVRQGAPLYVKGDFRTEMGHGDAYKLPGLTKFALMVFDFQSRSLRNIQSLLDLNKDGKVTEKEMLESYPRYAKFSRAQAKESIAGEQEFTVFGIIKSSDDHVLTIADTHQNQLVQRMGNFNTLRMIGGCILVTMALGILLLIYKPQ